MKSGPIKAINLNTNKLKSIRLSLETKKILKEIYDEFNKPKGFLKKGIIVWYTQNNYIIIPLIKKLSQTYILAIITELYYKKNPTALYTYTTWNEKKLNRRSNEKTRKVAYKIYPQTPRIYEDAIKWFKNERDNFLEEISKKYNESNTKIERIHKAYEIFNLKEERYQFKFMKTDELESKRKMVESVIKRSKERLEQGERILNGIKKEIERRATRGKS